MKLIDRFFKSSNDLVEIATLYLLGLGGKDVNLPLSMDNLRAAQRFWRQYIRLSCIQEYQD